MGKIDYDKIYEEAQVENSSGGIVDYDKIFQETIV